MPIRIIAIGKKHEAWIVDGVQRYEKRMKQPFKAEWVLLPHSERTDIVARQNESERILGRIRMDDYVVLLDERGKLIGSPAISSLLSNELEASREVVIVIGGAYGVDQTVHERANFIWSLSPLVFPHQLVRLLLIEQLYRAQGIFQGTPYHHT